jgi:hypothetical protein
MTRCWFRSGLVLAALLISAPTVRAQVNTEPLRKRIKQKGFSFILEGTFDGRTGNTRGVTANGLIGGGVATGDHLAFAFGRVDYSKLNGTLGVDKTFAHVRYNYEVARWAWAELFAQAQSDVFQRIKIRNLFGAGPRIALYEDNQLGLFLGVAYMYERDVIEVKPGATDVRTPTHHRVSSYLSAHATLSDGIDAVTTTYAQPRIDDASDIRILSESGFVFKVTKTLSTSIVFTAHYDSNPPTGVLTTDTELKNAITLTL